MENNDSRQEKPWTLTFNCLSKVVQRFNLILFHCSILLLFNAFIFDVNHALMVPKIREAAHQTEHARYRQLVPCLKTRTQKQTLSLELLFFVLMHSSLTTFHLKVDSDGVIRKREEKVVALTFHISLV